ncbi:MAG: LamG domain-containing protein, partial [Caldilineaceae bacterium]|nr:LamG domain-containing protein [Caldilineaceae bacterium]
DAVTLPSATVPTGAQITIAFWAFGGNTLPKNHSLLEAKDANNQRTLNIHLPFGNSSIIFDCGNDGNTYDRIQKAADPADFRGRWTHWAFSKDSNVGMMMIYQDGLLWHQGANKQRMLPAVTRFILGRTMDLANRFYPGRLAHLRIYDRALDAAEIGALMAADQLQSPPNYAYPLDFGLYDEHYQPVLLIDEQQANQTLQLTLRNTAGQPLRFAALDDNNPSADNYHLRLRFRPSTLSAKALDTVELNTNPWRMSRPNLDDNGVVSFYLLNRGNEQRRTLAADEEVILELHKLSAAGLGGARTTRVELSYQNLTEVGDATPLVGNRLQTLRILHAGSPAAQPHLPVRAGILGGNRVLNDGVTANTLQLRIVNTGHQPIPLNGPESDAPTRLLLRFDVGQTPAEDWWALATASQVAAIDVQADGWAVRNEFEGIIPFWTLTPEAGITALAPGAQVTITLSNLVTNFVAGETQARLVYENLAGYGDGELTVALAKSVLLVGEQTVGIGQLPSKARLSVRGTIASEQYAFFVRAQPQLTIFPPLETPISPGLAPSAAQASVPKAGPGGKIPATQKQYVIDFNDPHDQINPQGVYDARRKAFIAPLAGIYYLSTTIQVSESANLGESFTLSLIR